MKTPSSKLQAPEKLQIPSSEAASGLTFEQRLQSDFNPFTRRAVLPHPGPLPLGEGVTFATSDENCEAEQTSSPASVSEPRWQFPSPSGRGVKGEGESLDFQSGQILAKRVWRKAFRK